MNRLPRYPAYAALLILLTACTHNPFRTAQTVEQQGDALYGTYVIGKEQGAALLQDTAISDEAKRPVAEAMVASKPMGDAGFQLLSQYSVIKAQVASGETSEEQLRIVEANIQRWIVESKPLIDDLIAAVRGAL